LVESQLTAHHSGIAWFAIPWLTATTMGLAGLALEQFDVWPTYPNRLAKADVDAGLVLPNAAVALLGQGGGIATLFLAVSTLGTPQPSPH
jgi:urea-proton symporter